MNCRRSGEIGLKTPPMASEWIEVRDINVIKSTPLIGTAEAARIIGTTPRTVARMVDAGQLKGAKIGGRWRIDLDDLIRRIDDGVADAGERG